MKIEKLTEPNGLISGIRYHDQILHQFVTCAEKCSLKVMTDNREFFLLDFSGVFSSSLRKFLPRTIILSMFLWDVTAIQEWFIGHPQFLECSEDGPILSKYIFFMDSSYGASLCVAFDFLKVIHSKNNEVIYDL